MIDNRSEIFPVENVQLIASLCDRRFGIGADGLILLEEDDSADFKMVYFNSDGNQSTMCGNGARCLVAFAQFMGIVSRETSFNAVDGLHRASIENDIVELGMGSVHKIVENNGTYFLDTGSPHHVQLIENLDDFNVFEEGKKLRYGLYGEEGSNINFVEPINKDKFAVRTYERGVEDETLSCGTGVTAVAIAMHRANKVKSNEVNISTRGGDLKVRFKADIDTYRDVSLIGPAKQVFKGEIEC